MFGLVNAFALGFLAQGGKTALRFTFFVLRLFDTLLRLTNLIDGLIDLVLCLCQRRLATRNFPSQMVFNILTAGESLITDVFELLAEFVQLGLPFGQFSLFCDH